jgi:hypothetical protein
VALSNSPTRLHGVVCGIYQPGTEQLAAALNLWLLFLAVKYSAHVTVKVIVFLSLPVIFLLSQFSRTK